MKCFSVDWFFAICSFPLCTIKNLYNTLILHHKEQAAFKMPSNPSFHDPAIMSAQFASAGPGPDVFTSPIPASAASHSQIAFGPPPGLSFPPGLSPSPAPLNVHHQHRGYDASQANGSAHGESFPLHIRGEGVPGQSTSTEHRAYSVRKIYYRP